MSAARGVRTPSPPPGRTCGGAALDRSGTGDTNHRRLAADELAAAAVAYARAGLAVVPLAGKRPRLPNGFHGSSTDPEVAARWWAGPHRGANVGVVIPAGAVVLDVDPRHAGDATLARLEGRLGPLPPTRTALSGRGDGGRHLWFRRPAGDLRHDLGAGIDVRPGGRGFVVAPPSRHPETGRPYVWTDTGPVAELPPAWQAAIRRPPPPPPRPVPTVPGSRRAYLEAALRDAADRVARAVPGTRNLTLNAEAWTLARLAGDGLDPATIEAVLITAAVTAGLPHREAVGTVRSALRARLGGRR